MEDPRLNWPPPTTERLLSILLGELLLRHPWPWAVDHDWSWEVLDANGQRVALCVTAKEAGALIRVARAHVDEMAAYDEGAAI